MKIGGKRRGIWTRGERTMTTREEALNFGLSFPNTYQSAPFHDENWQLVRVKGSKKVFLWTYERNGFINLNVKVNDEWRDFWRDAFESVIPGWHQNKENWNTIILDGSIPDKDIKRMITESYEIVTDSPTKRIYEAVKKILHKNPDPENIPCFRVVNSKGELSGAFAFGGENEQKKRLEADGIKVEDGRVELSRYGVDW